MLKLLLLFFLVIWTSTSFGQKHSSLSNVQEKHYKTFLQVINFLKSQPEPPKNIKQFYTYPTYDSVITKFYDSWILEKGKHGDTTLAGRIKRTEGQGQILYALDDLLDRVPTDDILIEPGNKMMLIPKLKDSLEKDMFKNSLLLSVYVKNKKMNVLCFYFRAINNQILQIDSHILDPLQAKELGEEYPSKKND